MVYPLLFSECDVNRRNFGNRDGDLFHVHQIEWRLSKGGWRIVVVACSIVKLCGLTMNITGFRCILCRQRFNDKGVSDTLVQLFRHSGYSHSKSLLSEEGLYGIGALRGHILRRILQWVVVDLQEGVRQSQTLRKLPQLVERHLELGQVSKLAHVLWKRSNLQTKDVRNQICKKPNM